MGEDVYCDVGKGRLNVVSGPDKDNLLQDVRRRTLSFELPVHAKNRSGRGGSGASRTHFLGLRSQPARYKA